MIKYRKAHGLTYPDLSAEDLKDRMMKMIVFNGNSRSVKLHWNPVNRHYQIDFTDSERNPQIIERIERIRTFGEAKHRFKKLCKEIVTWTAVRGLYNGRWEDVTWEPTRQQGLETLRLYQQSEPGTQFTVKEVKYLEKNDGS